MAFNHIDTWVFDLDNTLYDAMPHAFPQMGQRMTAFVADLLGIPADEADILRRSYFHTYGTTLRGLMSEHGIAPEAFLSYAHDFDLAPIAPCTLTRATLHALPGRKLVFTNSPRHFADRMLSHLGLESAFDAVFAVEDAGYLPKPAEAVYDLFLERHGIAPARACMVEDMQVNLVPAHARGMTTVWLHGDGEDGTTADHPHVHHRCARLPDFFSRDYFTSLAKAAP